MAVKIVAEWEGPVNYPHSPLDIVFPYGLFSQPVEDTNVDHYEVERFDPDEGVFMTIGNPRTARIEFPAEDFENATVRIRAVLNNGNKTPYIISGMQVFSMVAEFDTPNNTILLSFI